MPTLGDLLLGRQSGGLLDLMKQYGAGVKQRVGLLADDPAEFTRQALLDVLPNEAEANAARAKLMGGSLDPQAYQSYMGKLQDMGNFLGSIRVYHGSPHKFDKFDLSKIGTGEGAQAYGHGGYFAESKDVAEQYRKANSTYETIVNGKVITPDDPNFSGAMHIAAAGGYDKAKAKIQGFIDAGVYGRGNEEFGRKALNEIEALKDSKIVQKQRGALYEANLRWPDAAREAADPLGPQHFLDWDKPLSEQPAAVRNVMEKYVAPRRAVESVPSGAEWGDLAAPRNYDPTGAELLQLLRGNLNRMDADTVLSGGIGPEVSAKLRELGIPGIRYLDAGSRGAGQGSSNYVVFDDNLIDILTRNGVPIGK